MHACTHPQGEKLTDFAAAAKLAFNNTPPAADFVATLFIPNNEAFAAIGPWLKKLNVTEVAKVCF